MTYYCDTSIIEEVHWLYSFLNNLFMINFKILEVLVDEYKIIYYDIFDWKFGCIINYFIPCVPHNSLYF